MENAEEQMVETRSLIAALGGGGEWNYVTDVNARIREAYPQCICSSFIAKIVPDNSKQILARNSLFADVVTADWFLDRSETQTELFTFFAKSGCLPLIFTDVGALVLNTSGGSMSLNDTCFCYSEYGDSTFNDDKVFKIGWDFRSLCRFIYARYREGSCDWCADIEALIPDLVNPYA